MTDIAQLLLSAVAVGCVYAIIALSLELAYESTGIVNFATGQLVVIGALVSASALAYSQSNMAVSYLATFVAMAVAGVAFYQLVIRPLGGMPISTVVIGTVAVGIAVQNISLMTWGPFPFSVESPAGSGLVRLFGTAVPLHTIVVIGATAVLILAVYALLNLTPIGRQLRAVAQDAEAARLMGIHVKRVYLLVWVLVAVLAAAAGILLAPMWFVDVTVGDSLALKAFAAAIIGGFGSIPGAICGGILVGLAEVFGAYYVSSSYKDAIVFLLMIGFLLFRPQGLFGERHGDRG